MAPAEGLEPPTHRLTADCSTIELRWNNWWAKRDSNPHGFTRLILSQVRLPIPSFAQLVDVEGVEPSSKLHPLITFIAIDFQDFSVLRFHDRYVRGIKDLSLHHPIFTEQRNCVLVYILKTNKTWQDLFYNRGLLQAECFPALLGTLRLPKQPGQSDEQKCR